METKMSDDFTKRQSLKESASPLVHMSRGNIRDLTQNTMAAATDVTKPKFYSAKEWLCTCIIILGTFLCRPLESNNVRLLSSRSSGKREPHWLFFLKRIVFGIERSDRIFNRSKLYQQKHWIVTDEREIPK